MPATDDVVAIELEAEATAACEMVVEILPDVIGVVMAGTPAVWKLVGVEMDPASETECIFCENDADAFGAAETPVRYLIESWYT